MRLQVVSDDGIKLHCWLIKQADSRNKPTILFFQERLKLFCFMANLITYNSTFSHEQENAGNMGMRLPSMNMLWARLQVNVFMVSYRGYGRSEGEPDEKGIKMDADAVITHLTSRKDIDTKRIIVLGRSLGGAVGVYVASKCASRFALLHGVLYRPACFITSRGRGGLSTEQVSGEGAGPRPREHLHQHRRHGDHTYC
jgi:hypothetical protein